MITDLVIEVDLLGDFTATHKAEVLFHLTMGAIKHDKLSELWQAKRATCPKSLARILISESVLNVVRKQLRHATGHNVSVEEIARLVKDTCLRPECF